MFDVKMKKKLPKRVWSLVGMWNIDLEWKCLRCQCLDPSDEDSDFVWMRIRSGDDPLVIPGATFADPSNPKDHWTTAGDAVIATQGLAGLKAIEKTQCSHPMVGAPPMPGLNR